MVRVSREAKAQSRLKIIEEAARLFRENGIEATGVAQVMSAAGLTHGGFYRHFPSKDALVCEAIETVIGARAGALERDILKRGAKPAIAAFIDQYLSPQHVAARGKGCPIAALGSEISRGPDLYQQSITCGTEQIVEQLAIGFGGSPDEARAKAVRLFAILVGSIVLARSAQSPDVMNEFLAAGRQNVKTLCLE